jgi:protein-tyrosine phosphatase
MNLPAPESSSARPAPPTDQTPFRVLFVCTGNICRSPLAHGLFLHHVRARGLSAHYDADSAGTTNWHEGEAYDERSLRVAAGHHVPLPGLSRPVVPEDFRHYDWLVAMDRTHFRELRRRAAVLSPGSPEAFGGEVRLMGEWCTPIAGGAAARRAQSSPSLPGMETGTPDLWPDVPDPYYGHLRDFEDVYRMLDDGIARLLDTLEAR